MSESGPCNMWMAVQHIVIAFFTFGSTVIGMFLVHRRIRADRERRAMKCSECRRVESELVERNKARRGNGRQN
jgi:hypothetical protein